MEYTDMIFEAIKKQELDRLLKGEGKYQLETSQYAPSAEPTDVGKMLSKVVYKAYKKDLSIKEKIEETLLVMLGQTDYDVYIVILYIMSELFKEKNEISPFKMDMSHILPRLRDEINNRADKIKEGIVYPDGFLKKSAWDEIQRFNHVCQEEYGIKLF